MSDQDKLDKALELLQDMTSGGIGFMLIHTAGDAGGQALNWQMTANVRQPFAIDVLEEMVRTMRLDE